MYIFSRNCLHLRFHRNGIFKDELWQFVVTKPAGKIILILLQERLRYMYSEQNGIYITMVQFLKVKWKFMQATILTLYHLLNLFSGV